MRYTWIDDETSIISQITDKFKSAAILLNPFTEMSDDYARLNLNKDIGPLYSEVLDYGKAISWRSILNRSGLDSYEQLEIALQTSIGALKSEFSRKDLSNTLFECLPSNFLVPEEDKISEFFIRDFCNYLKQKNETKIYYHDPLTDNSGEIDLTDYNIDDIYELFVTEMYICDEHLNFALMSVYDSFNTLFLSKKENFEEILKDLGWEYIICDKDMCINWYLKNLNSRKINIF